MKKIKKIKAGKKNIDEIKDMIKYALENEEDLEIKGRDVRYILKAGFLTKLKEGKMFVLGEKKQWIKIS